MCVLCQQVTDGFVPRTPVPVQGGQSCPRYEDNFTGGFLYAGIYSLLFAHLLPGAAAGTGAIQRQLHYYRRKPEFRRQCEHEFRQLQGHNDDWAKFPDWPVIQRIVHCARRGAIYLFQRCAGGGDFSLPALDKVSDKRPLMKLRARRT